MAKEKTIPIDVAAKTPLYVEIDADTTSVKFSFAEEGKATSYMYKVDGKKMTSQTDSKLSTVKKMKITNESTNSILSRIEGNTVFNVEKHHGYILWVRLFYEGNSESPCAEAVLVLAPAKLAILNVAACDDRDKTIGGAPFAYRANKRISFQFEYSRPLLKGEKPSILYKIYANKPGEKELCETPIIDSHKDIADLLCVDEGLPESHAGANLAISFGLNDPYEPPFEGKYKTVKFINLTSSEVHKPQITWIVWSSKESAEFGGKSPVRDKICSNEDAFLHIHTRGMYGQKVRVEIYEKDDTFTKALFLKSFNNLLILDNVACVPIAMDEIFSKAKQERWFEGSDYEIIAKVIPNDTSVAAAESKILKLDTTQKEAASPTKSTVNGTQKFTIGSASGKDAAAAKSACPRCREEAKKMLPRLKEIFPKVAESKLSVVAETYTKYMRQLGMDSCWNKAHFFAQVAIETGHKLDLKDGESFNYYWEALCGTFGAFKTDEGKKKAKEWGRSEKKAKAVSTENQKKIANYAYSPSCNTGKQLGNTLATDGWNFRGRGLIQLTGRAGYAYAHTYTKIEGVDILSNPDLVGTDLKIGVLAAMAFWKWKGLQIKANGTLANQMIPFICKKVGNDIKIKDQEGQISSNHQEKKRFFTKESSVSFPIKECRFGAKISENDIENSKTNRPPWMTIALNQIKKSKGCKEGNEPMYSMAKKYLKYVGITAEPTDGTNGPWCAAFMNWCIKQTSYNHARSASSLAPIHSETKMKYTKIDTPIYGCIVVYKHTQKWLGHTGFLYGKTKEGKYILLGGNQNDTIRFDEYGQFTSNSKTKKFYGFYVPTDYIIKEEDHLTENDISTASILNRKFGITTEGGGKTT